MEHPATLSHCACWRGALPSPAVKQTAQAAGKMPVEEHPTGTEDAKQSVASGRSYP
ncbi:hypothetical protein BHE74_00025026 [Ensete ventricosum]|nr:hypothetical protein BHE74_00025026 [Ensete ventricosum]RZR82657.1 hypothetical protein BHM03_00009111 [Ensete ventricosum]